MNDTEGCILEIPLDTLDTHAIMERRAKLLAVRATAIALANAIGKMYGLPKLDTGSQQRKTARER